MATRTTYRDKNTNEITITIKLKPAECYRLFFLLNTLKLIKHHVPHFARLQNKEVSSLNVWAQMVHPGAEDKEYLV